MNRLASPLREVTFWLILVAVLWIMGFSAWVMAYYTARRAKKGMKKEFSWIRASIN